jgi:hypothetical protein
VLPDFTFSDLYEASTFITQDPLKEYLREITDTYTASAKKTSWIVLIGGNTRSGKSTLASYLRIAFEKMGKKVLSVCLDNWLKPEDQRTPDMNGYQRYQLGTIEEDMKAPVWNTCFPYHLCQSSGPVAPACYLLGKRPGYHYH